MYNNNFTPLPSNPAADQGSTLAVNQRPTLAELQSFTVNGETVNIITDVADNWRRVCAAFNFDTDGRTLNRIDQKFPNKPKDCCREMFQTWLKTKGATWKCLVAVLDSAGEGRLANSVKAYADITQGEACFNRHIFWYVIDKIIFTRQS